MSDFTEFEQTLMSAPDTFFANGKVCPRCGEGTLDSDGMPDDALMHNDWKNEYRWVEYFTCSECELHVAVMEVYEPVAAKRQIRISEDSDEAFFNIQSTNP